jgi:hypothetical protein
MIEFFTVYALISLTCLLVFRKFKHELMISGPFAAIFLSIIWPFTLLVILSVWLVGFVEYPVEDFMDKWWNK